MRLKLNILLLVMFVAIALGISGCAKDSGVVLAKDNKTFFEDAAYAGESKILGEDKTGSEQYRVFQQAATGFVPGSVVRREVEEQAYNHCEKKR